MSEENKENKELVTADGMPTFGIAALPDEALEVTRQEAQKEEDARKTYVEQIKVTYKSSDHFPEGAGLGEFYFKEASMGKELDVTLISFRHKILVLEGAAYEASISFHETEPHYKQTQKYKDFEDKYKGKKDFKYLEGFDLLMYLPKYKEYGVLFCKSTLKPCAFELINLVKKNRCSAKLTTHAEPGFKVEKKPKLKVSWYVFTIEETPFVPFPIKEAKEKYDLFNAKPADAAIDDKLNGRDS